MHIKTRVNKYQENCHLIFAEIQIPFLYPDHVTLHMTELFGYRQHSAMNALPISLYDFVFTLVGNL